MMSKIDPGSFGVDEFLVTTALGVGRLDLAIDLVLEGPRRSADFQISSARLSSLGLLRESNMGGVSKAGSLTKHGATKGGSKARDRAVVTRFSHP